MKRHPWIGIKCCEKKSRTARPPSWPSSFLTSTPFGFDLTLSVLNISRYVCMAGDVSVTSQLAAFLPSPQGTNLLGYLLILMDFLGSVIFLKPNICFLFLLFVFQDETERKPSQGWNLRGSSMCRHCSFKHHGSSPQQPAPSLTQNHRIIEP